MKAPVFLIVFCLGLFTASAQATQALVFDDSWDDFYRQLSREEPKLMPPGWREKIELSPPPDDAFTRVELKHIQSLKPLRKHYQGQIDAELRDVVQPFVDSLKLDVKQVTALRAFWDEVVPDITRVHMYYKAKFNRARPRQYDKSLEPTIEPPGHPSYPSGHATDAYTLAMVLSQAWPEKTSQLMSIAFRIAFHREIGGVHFHSDTAAGQSLARQIVALLPRNPRASKLLDTLRAQLRSTN